MVSSPALPAGQKNLITRIEPSVGGGGVFLSTTLIVVVRPGVSEMLVYRRCAFW